MYQVQGHGEDYYGDYCEDTWLSSYEGRRVLMMRNGTAYQCTVYDECQEVTDEHDGEEYEDDFVTLS